MSDHAHFARLLKLAEPLPPMPTAVVAPENATSLGGALLGMDHTLIIPILVGDPDKIHAAAAELGRSIDGIELIAATDHDAAARAAVEAVRDGRAGCLMKGQLHTGELLGAVMRREGGLRTGRRLSHVFVQDVPRHDRLLLISDAAINIFPDLDTKVDITQNAIDLARALGVAVPNVAIMSAVETVNPKIPATVDAEALKQLAASGKISGGTVDGPFAMDNAVSVVAAKIKGMDSAVAGRADVLVMPSMEAGNLVVKALTFLANAQTGGLVLGAAAPIILTSRADDDQARLASCVIATLYQHALQSQT